MFQGLSTLAQRLLSTIQPRIVLPLPAPVQSPDERRLETARLEKLKRVILTDGVGRTLFEEFADHSLSERRHEETGWLLLGLRRASEAIVLATLPAGSRRDAGVAHVRFDSASQMVASRLLRQQEPDLRVLGIVHTHPGTLRHPSSGDFRGDSVWVRQLRGHEGVFGIGTLEKDRIVPDWLVERPRPHIHRQANRRFTWYVLGASDKHYRQLAAEFTVGPDMGRDAHAAWATIERHAAELERICRQQARVSVRVGTRDDSDLKVTVPLAEPGDAIEIEILGERVVFFVKLSGESHLVEPREPGLETGLYLILGELAKRAKLV
jgi:proteasome lid subunit RPN8/RPN11